MLTAVFWKKSWTWLKHYWYWPVIILLIVFSFFAGRGIRSKMFDLLNAQKQSYKKEIDVLKKVSEEKEAKKNDAFAGYQKEIEKIEEKHQVKIADLHDEKKEELASTIEKNKDNPESLAREVAKVLSAQFHKNNRS